MSFDEPSSRTGQDPGDRRRSGTASVPVLRALHRGDVGAARDATRSASAERGLVGALRSFLDRPSSDGVYARPSAFEEFIENGDNPPLYAATTAALRDVHLDLRPASVLDIGCGDGRVTRGCLVGSTERVDLVEPSAALLATAVDVRLRDCGATVVGHGCTLQELLRSGGPDLSWDLAQATFAFHTLDPSSRRRALSSLADRVTVLAIVEFDVPDLEVGSSEHLGHLAERHEAGVAMYADHPAVVDDFLMPVLVGQLDRNRTRHTWEQPIERWIGDLAAAGFEHSTRHVFDHWWAPAHLIIGTRPERTLPCAGRSAAELNAR